MLVELYLRFKSLFLKTVTIFWETYCFCAVSLFFFLACFFFFPLKFCPDEFSVTTGLIVLKFGDMIEMYMMFCKKVSKFKMSDSKTGTWACQKLPKSPNKNFVYISLRLKHQSWLQQMTNFATSFLIFKRNKEWYFMRMVCQQTILMKYHALFVIFEKEANLKL